MNELTPQEKAELAVYRDAIDLIFDHGKWQRTDKGLFWIIPEGIADTVQAMIGDLEDAKLPSVQE